MIYFFQTSVFAQVKKREHNYYVIAEKKFNHGNYAEALELNTKALKIAEKQNDCNEIAYAKMQVAKMLYFLNNRRLALNSFIETKKLLDSCNIDSLKYKLYHNIGTIYSEFNELDSSLVNLNKALRFLKNTKKYTELTRTHVVIAGLFIERMGNISDGDKHLIEAEKFSILSKDSLLIAFTISKRGRWFYEKKDYKKAFIFYNKSLLIYENAKNTNGILYQLRAISDVKAKLKTNDIMESYRKYILLKDSIFSKETSKQIAEYKVKYESEKKDKENAILQQKLKTNQAKIETRNRTIIGLIVGILLIIIFVLWIINVLRLKKNETELKRLTELQKEKERISRDLHDNVGGQLSFILFTLDGLNEENPIKRKKLISNINDSVRSVISNLRETIWAIHEEDISLNDFSDKLKTYTRNMFRNSSTQVVFLENLESDFKVQSLLGLNLYRICQEIINNAFKYSKASEISISIKSTDKITIQINDNGIGFDINEEIASGFGLNIIKNRAQEVGINLRVQSEIGKGTKFTLAVEFNKL
ncbi:MAG: ATP-binding protein [Bacteroidota bacterium]